MKVSKIATNLFKVDKKVVVVIAGLFMCRTILPGTNPIVRGQEVAYFSYTTGCYSAYLAVCQKLEQESKRYPCMDEGLDRCPKRGERFSNWIEKGKKK